jgi:hypothetical protein
MPGFSNLTMITTAIENGRSLLRSGKNKSSGSSSGTTAPTTVSKDSDDDELNVVTIVPEQLNKMDLHGDSMLQLRQTWTLRS